MVAYLDNEVQILTGKKLYGDIPAMVRSEGLATVFNGRTDGTAAAHASLHPATAHHPPPILKK